MKDFSKSLPDAPGAHIYTAGLAWGKAALKEQLGYWSRHGLTTVCDVRRFPDRTKDEARRPAWLAPACRVADLHYAPMPCLGPPPAMFDAYVAIKGGDSAWWDFTRAYNTYLSTTEGKEGRAAVRTRLERGERVVLICVERDPRRCHRTSLGHTFGARELPPEGQLTLSTLLGLEVVK